VALIAEGKPIRSVLRWIVYATVASALIAGVWEGRHGAASALLGGLVNLTAGAAFGWIATRAKPASAGETLRVLLRAEATKIALIIAQLWLILANYQQVVLLAFFATFTVTVIVFSMAFFVRQP
jgi:ATP synthase protein I